MFTFTPFTETVTWLDDHSTSTVDYRSDNESGGVSTLTGVVTAGRYVRDTVVKQYSLSPNTDVTFAECAAGTGTISSVNLVGTISFSF